MINFLICSLVTIFDFSFEMFGGMLKIMNYDFFLKNICVKNQKKKKKLNIFFWFCKKAYKIELINFISVIGIRVCLKINI